MCSKDKILGFLNVETGSLIFGCTISISSGLLILIILLLMVGFNLSPPHPYFDRALFTAVMIPILVIVSISFVFSLLLLNGLLKKLPVYVKAYFVYGIIKSILYSIGCIIVIVFFPFIGLPILIFCVIYGFILHMIRMTYLKMTAGLVYNTTQNTPSEI